MEEKYSIYAQWLVFIVILKPKILYKCDTETLAANVFRQNS